MKKCILFIELLFFAIIAPSQVPDYFINAPKWHTGYHYGQGPETWSWDDIYSLNGDTIINGENYHCVWLKSLGSHVFGLASEHWITEGRIPKYVRQEGRSIRFATHDFSDSLLVDYDYQVGDTAKGYITGNCPVERIVQKIDSVLIYSEYRRVIYLDTLWGTVLIEGIGHLVSFGSPVGEFLKDEWGGFGFDSELLCYGQAGVPIWDFQFGNGQGCLLDVELGTDELKGTDKKTIVKIIDVMGREIKEQNNTLLICIFSDGSVQKLIRTD